MMQIPYHETFKLLTPLLGAVCWNYSNDVTADLPAGATVTLDHTASRTETVITVAKESQPVECSNGQSGYRFIVKNAALGPAIGRELPEKTKDLVGDIMRFESGEMEEDEIREFLQELHDDGVLQSLQGSYQRAYQHYCVNYREACA